LIHFIMSFIFKKMNHFSLPTDPIDQTQELPSPQTEDLLRQVSNHYNLQMSKQDSD